MDRGLNLRAHLAAQIRIDGQMGKKATKGTAEPGATNNHGQVVVRSTELPGTDHGARVVVMRCEHCAAEYGANSTDAWQRKCPECQDGKPGLDYEK